MPSKNVHVCWPYLQSYILSLVTISKYYWPLERASLRDFEHETVIFQILYKMKAWKCTCFVIIRSFSYSFTESPGVKNPFVTKLGYVANREHLWLKVLLTFHYLEPAPSRRLFDTFSHVFSEQKSSKDHMEKSIKHWQIALTGEIVD